MKFREEDVWHPTPEFLNHSNLSELIKRMGLSNYDEFLRVSIDNPQWYWDETLKHMNVVFDPPSTNFVDISQGKPWARFFPKAGFNFAAACLSPPPGQAGADQSAIIAESEDREAEYVSYRELAIRTKALAAGLSGIGVKAGDRVGLFFPSSADAVISFLAVCYMGAIVVPLYSGFGADAVSRRLIDSGAGYFIAASGFSRKGKHVPLASIAAAAIATTPLCKLILAYEDGAPKPDIAHWRWQDLAKSDGAGIAPAKTAADDPYMIIYTSGTSGKPKGVVHLHAGFPLRVAQDTAFMFDFRAGDRFFWPSDMGWMVGPYSICAALLLKGALVLYSGAADWPDISRLRKVAARTGVTHFGSTPTAIRSMAISEDLVLSVSAPSLRVLMTGGEVIDADAHAWFFHKFGDGRLPVINYTGGTECSGALLTNVVLRPIAPCRFNSTTPGVDVHVVDDSGAPVSGMVGELAVFKPFNGMTHGFWDDAARYIDTYWSRIPGMWVHGDLAEEEGDGQFILLGRSDDVMKISGRRVGPSEIEGSVIDGDYVSDAVAFGVPDPKTGEAMVLFVVPGPSKNPHAPDQIEQHVKATIRQKMGSSFGAHTVIVLPELIKTRNGKLVRRLARQAWLNERPGDLSAIENPATFERVAALCVALRQQREASTQ